MIPVSRAKLWAPCAVAPHTHTRTSLEELPPSTGRFCASATVLPCRAAPIAAQIPASPPPTTVRSDWTSSCCMHEPLRYLDERRCLDERRRPDRRRSPDVRRAVPARSGDWRSGGPAPAAPPARTTDLPSVHRSLG